MKKVVRVGLPLNVTQNNKFMFQPYQAYEWRSSKVRNLHSVFITHSGFCMNQHGLIKECHHDCPSQQEYYINEAAKYYCDVEDHPENLIILDNDNCYLCIHHPWFNYYHWLAESIFRLWLVRHRANDLTLVLPESYRHVDFIMGSLEPFNLKRIFYIPAGKNLLVKNLCLPQIKPIIDSFSRNELDQVRCFYNHFLLPNKGTTSHLGDKIYVSRALSKRRRAVNESDVCALLNEYGVSTFYPEKHTFVQQLAVCSNATLMIGVHGAGLTNMLFMKPGSVVLELHQSKTNDYDHPSPLFWYMAHGLDLNYYQQLCYTTGKGDFFDDDYIVDTELLERNLIAIKNNHHW